MWGKLLHEKTAPEEVGAAFCRFAAGLLACGAVFVAGCCAEPEAQLAMRKINLTSLSSDQERDTPTHSNLPLFRTEQRPRQQSLLEVTLKDSPYYQNLIVSSEL